MQVVHEQKECDMHMAAQSAWAWLYKALVGTGWSILALDAQMGLQNTTLTKYRGFISGREGGLHLEQLFYWPWLLTMGSLLMSTICIGLVGVMQVCFLQVHLGFVLDSEL